MATLDMLSSYELTSDEIDKQVTGVGLQYRLYTVRYADPSRDSGQAPQVCALPLLADRYG